MTVVHNHPHPMAQKVVLPTNMAIHAKFGAVRVEDWDDRVAGFIWTERAGRNPGPEIYQYVSDAKEKDETHGDGTNEVVRCHSLTTGELILLHDDWISDHADGTDGSSKTV